MNAPATTNNTGVTNTSINSNTATNSSTGQNAPATTTVSKPQEIVIPSATTLTSVAKLAIEQDKKIMLDYYVESLNEKAFIGEDATSKDQRVLIKTRKDFTSLVQKIYKVGDDYLIMTENSIYVVSCKIKKRPINLASLEYDYNDDE